MSTATAPSPSVKPRRSASKRGRPRTARSPASTDTFTLRLTRGPETTEVICPWPDALARMTKWMKELAASPYTGGPIAVAITPAVRTPVVTRTR